MSDQETPQSANIFATDSNSIPDGAYVGTIDTPDGFTLRYARWEAVLRPSKGTVLILHGRTECIEKYYETIDGLRARGFGVLTFDWRGQGASTRLLKDARKGHIEHFNQYLTDFETILSEVALPDCKSPLYILAHSTGGLVALLAAPALTNRIRRMVLVSPLIALNNLPVGQKWLQRLFGIMSFIGLGRLSVVKSAKSIENRPFVSNKLTSDTKRFARNKSIIEANKELGLASPTVSWMFAACRAMAQIKEPGYSNTVAIPTLLIAGGNDPVVEPAAIEEFGKKMRSGAFLTISGAKHEILHERDVYREQALAAFDAFVPGTEV